jgi:ribosomal protein L37AE/L43A
VDEAQSASELARAPAGSGIRGLGGVEDVLRRTAMTQAFKNCPSCGAINDTRNTMCRTCGYQLKGAAFSLPNDPNVTRACEEEIAARGVPVPDHQPFRTEGTDALLAAARVVLAHLDEGVRPDSQAIEALREAVK